MSDPLIVLRRAVAVHQALAAAGIASAIGGALALAYHVGEARATQDIDLNVALPRSEGRRALEALPADVPWTRQHLDTIERDGQVRIMWPVPDGPPMPLDLFFAEHAFHAVAASRILYVPMLDTSVPILSATDLTVFKTLSDHPKDWVDISEMVAEDPPSLDLDEAVDWVTDIVGADDARVVKLGALPPPGPQP